MWHVAAQHDDEKLAAAVAVGRLGQTICLELRL
jgi:hypothetical protein